MSAFTTEVPLQMSAFTTTGPLQTSEFTTTDLLRMSAFTTSEPLQNSTFTTTAYSCLQFLQGSCRKFLELPLHYFTLHNITFSKVTSSGLLRIFTLDTGLLEISTTGLMLIPANTATGYLQVSAVSTSGFCIIFCSGYYVSVTKL